MGICLSGTGDNQGCHCLQIICSKPVEVTSQDLHGNSVEITVSDTSRSIQIHLLISKALCEDEGGMVLREHNVVVFVPVYEVTVANSGIRTKIEVLADECVKNMRRANEGLILPGELVYCDIKALDEEKTLFSQGVTNGTVLRTQRGGVAYATNDDRVALGELQVMGSAPPPPNYAPALQDAPLDATTPGFPPKPGLTSPVQPTSEAPAPAIQQGIPPKFGVALPQNCNSPVPVQRYGVLARLGMPMQYFDCTGDKVYSNTAPAVLYRGGQVYYPPYGWQRFGLKVRGKYGSDAWLGNTNGPREYPVSYQALLSQVLSVSSQMVTTGCFTQQRM